MAWDFELFIIPVLAGGVRAAVPLYWAALGEVFAERSGVINIGLEGIMLMGALVAVIVTSGTGVPWWGVFAALSVGIVLAAFHGWICIYCQGNQIAAGIALIIFGGGLSAFLGVDYVGRKIPGLADWSLPILSHVPVLGRILFQHDLLVYLMYLAVPLAWFILYRTHWGLMVRAVGEDPEAAASTGVNVYRIRFFSLVVGGALAGLAGAYISIAHTQLWLENMVAGRGLIAVALVVFGTWDPVKVFFGSLLFGAVSALQLRLQAAGVNVSSYLLSMLPYLLTIAVLIYATARVQRLEVGVPKALGIPFVRQQ
ncbi:MAG: ABC transporter permease [Nitrososphaera sp.]|nr:ABC transporter permease [Nitrososphaera sp.]